jgi:hypothetical protein
MLTIFLPAITPRVEYIFEYIFAQQFGIDFSLTSDLNKFENWKGVKINYSHQRIHDEFFIKAAPLLFERSITKQNIPLGETKDTKILFPNDESCDLGFDIFSSAFYMLSRYEEYLPFIPDLYGRFNGNDSLAAKNNFLQIAVVDRWLKEFKIILQKQFPDLSFKPSKFNVLLTYDIDVAYKFKARNLKRTAGSIIKDLGRGNYKNLRTRFNVIQNKQKDPWDTYEHIEKLLKKTNLPTIFFFLLGDTSKHDRNLDHNNHLMKKLVNKIASFSMIGVHPSFKSSIITSKISIEKIRLEKMSGKTITKSRQHFLKFRLPGTYNALIEAGITEDYSMGFPYSPGFRAGTSKPFYFYDLLNEKPTALKIYPVTLMEGNLKTNGNGVHEKMEETINNLINEVKSVDGTFISIWHNHTLAETNEFRYLRIIHDKMIKQICHQLDVSS